MNKPKLIATEILKQSPWFMSLDVILQAELLKNGHLLSYNEGDIIFAPSMAGGSLYALLHGSVRMTALSATGVENLFTVFEPVTWFGDVIIFEETVQRYSAIAQQDSQVFVLPRCSLEQITQKHPLIWQHIARLMNSKLQLLLLSYQVFRTANGAARLATRLLSISSNHGLWSNKRRCLITVTQDDLANMARLSRSRTNILLKEFERRGVLSPHYGKLELIDVALLQDIAEGKITIDL